MGHNARNRSAAATRWHRHLSSSGGGSDTAAPGAGATRACVCAQVLKPLVAAAARSPRRTRVGPSRAANQAVIRSVVAHIAARRLARERERASTRAGGQRWVRRVPELGLWRSDFRSNNARRRDSRGAARPPSSPRPTSATSRELISPPSARRRRGVRVPGRARGAGLISRNGGRGWLCCPKWVGRARVPLPSHHFR